MAGRDEPGAADEQDHASVVPMGECAVLIEVPGTSAALAWYERLRADPLPHQVDVVPGARSVLVRFAEPVQRPWIVGLSKHAGAMAGARPAGVAGAGPAGVAGARPAGAAEPVAEPAAVAIDVVYAGPDLDEVGRLTGLGRAGVVAAHTGTPWRVAFCGFAPGFGYLAGGDPRLMVPRRDSPRPQVPAGSVGLAGEYTGVYPTASPGGWQVIGRTDAALWRADRDPPALLRPGMAVRFRAARDAVTAGGELTMRVAVGAAQPQRGGDGPGPSVSERTQPPHPGRRPEPAWSGAALTVVRPGILCTVQDLGRVGLADQGVSPSGAADRGAAVRANRIVRNPVGAAVLEILLGQAEFRVEAPTVLAVTGAPVSLHVMDPKAAALPDSPPRAATMDRQIPLPAGARLRLGRAGRGLRSYLAVRGGFDGPMVLGSRSADLLAGIGPGPLRAGDVLPIGEAGWGTMHAAPALDEPEPSDLELLAGPQLSWFAAGALEHLAATEWVVGPASNRVGIRLTPQPGSDVTALERTVTAELPTQGLVRGAVQVPPSGELVVFLADHPVTGGYPVIGVLTEASVDRAAQARPGATVRLRPRSDCAGA